MAMLQMQRVNIIALKKDRKSILELLQRRGVMEVNDVFPEDSIFQRMDTSYARTGFEKNISLAKDAVDIINKYSPENKPLLSMLNGRKAITVEEYALFKDKYEKVVESAYRIIACSKTIAENKAEILKLEAQAEMLQPWLKLDIPLNFTGTKYTKSFIGTIPKEWTLDELYEKLADYMPINIDIISSSKEQTCIFVLCTRDKAEGVFDSLRAIDFSYPGVSSDKAPTEQFDELEDKYKIACKAIEEAEDEITELAISREDLMFLQDYDRMRADKYEVIGQILQSKNVIVISGYIPARDVADLEQEISSNYTASIEYETPSEEEDVPVLLNNNGFSAPLEGVLAGFSLPGKGEVDPTMVMSLFYYLLFGLMLSDAGYGFLMAAGCAFALLKFRSTMEYSMKKTLKMYLFCGISTVFWGIMFGSYFGDLFDVISETFFGVKQIVIPPLWFFPVNKPMQMLTFSMVLGLIHLLTGLIMKLYQLLKAKDYKSIVYDVLTWFFLIVSCTVLLMSMDMIKDILGLNVKVPAVIVNTASIVAVISAVLIVLTNGRESRNPFKRFLKGAYALYGITGYLSDVLSYSRLLALGLATGVIGSVINKMAAMAPKGLLRPLIFTIIVIIGHALNIAINALGAYVHTNRLQYVEFFGKFYEGGGRMFKPFGMNTKYYKIKEKM